MKSFFYIIPILLSLNTTIEAQSNYFAINGGVNLVTQKIQSVDYTVTPSRSAKIHIGVSYNIMLDDNFAFQPELQYSRHGHTGDDERYILDGSYNYIMAPLFFKAYVTPAFNIQFGGEIGAIIGGSGNYSYSTGNMQVNRTAPTDHLTIGAGLEIFVTDAFFIRGRYLQGLTDLNKHVGYIEQYSNNIQISVGLAL